MTPAELIGLVRQLIGEVARLRAESEKLNQVAAGLRVENQTLKEEIARLKGLPPRPSAFNLPASDFDIRCDKSFLALNPRRVASF